SPLCGGAQPGGSGLRGVRNNWLGERDPNGRVIGPAPARTRATVIRRSASGIGGTHASPSLLVATLLRSPERCAQKKFAAPLGFPIDTAVPLSQAKRAWRDSNPQSPV